MMDILYFILIATMIIYSSRGLMASYYARKLGKKFHFSDPWSSIRNWNIWTIKQYEIWWNKRYQARYNIISSVAVEELKKIRDKYSDFSEFNLIWKEIDKI